MIIERGSLLRHTRKDGQQWRDKKAPQKMRGLVFLILLLMLRTEQFKAEE